LLREAVASVGHSGVTMNSPSDLAATRRDVLIGTAAAVATTSSSSRLSAQTPTDLAPVISAVTFEVNGASRELSLDA
jgi:hypothetical protein